MTHFFRKPWYSFSREFLITLGILASIFSLLLGFMLYAELRGIKEVEERGLRADLQTMREAIDNYTLDRHSPPRTLQDLVDTHYLRAVPVDPITHSADWQLHFADVQISPRLIVNGIDDVHSASTRTASNGTRYDTW